MANDFKRYTKANVTTSTGTSSDAVYTVPSTGSTAMETVVIGIAIVHSTTSSTFCVFSQQTKEFYVPVVLEYTRFLCQNQSKL